VDGADLPAAAEAWRPWRALAAVHLWSHQQTPDFGGDLPRIR
jgi:3-methyladenine DNA glycosylase/8-oxoguanine DNA glycosylase